MADFTPIIDPLDGLSHTTVDEATRSTLWRAQLAQRMQFRGGLEKALVGNGAAALALRGNFQPLINAVSDAQQPPAPDDDEVQTKPVTNQDLNL